MIIMILICFYEPLWGSENCYQRPKNIHCNMLVNKGHVLLEFSSVKWVLNEDHSLYYNILGTLRSVAKKVVNLNDHIATNFSFSFNIFVSQKLKMQHIILALLYKKPHKGRESKLRKILPKWFVCIRPLIGYIFPKILQKNPNWSKKPPKIAKFEIINLNSHLYFHVFLMK